MKELKPNAGLVYDLLITSPDCTDIEFMHVLKSLILFVATGCIPTNHSMFILITSDEIVYRYNDKLLSIKHVKSKEDNRFLFENLLSFCKASKDFVFVKE